MDCFLRVDNFATVNGKMRAICQKFQNAKVTNEDRRQIAAEWRHKLRVLTA